MSKRSRTPRSTDSATRRTRRRTATGSRKAKAPDATLQMISNLWLCYHALKMSEWKDTNDDEHRCAYCAQLKIVGHQKDCMIGNALEWSME